jgi:chromate transporter
LRIWNHRLQASQREDGEAALTPVSFGAAFRFWLKLGFISFGGPAGQIAVMHQELVERRRWISEGRFLHALNYCMLLPGPEAQQLATYIGWLMHRTWGGIVAGGLFVLPSFVILTALSWAYVAHVANPVVAAVFYGIKPAVVAIVAFAAWRIGGKVLRNWMLAAIAAAAFLALAVLAIPFPIVIIGAGIVGWIGGRASPRLFAATETHTRGEGGHAAAVIDDDTPVPEHARHSRKRLIAIVLVGVAAWLLVMALLAGAAGMRGTAPVMGWFFTKAALVTFGGAYAVLPYVYQGAVEQYRWLTPGQMIDGLALGETTPGPLIMVVTFVGFVGAWAHANGLSPLVSALIGACTATYFTFLPSFLFIFAGAPLVESTRGNIMFSAPLTAITAAVVGVIANLASWFALHVLFARLVPIAAGPLRFDLPDLASLRWIPALLTALALVLMFALKQSLARCLAASAVAGILVTLLA